MLLDEGGEPFAECLCLFSHGGEQLWQESKKNQTVFSGT
jgi:hypothetical protein